MLNYDEVYSKPELYWGRTPNRMCDTAIGLVPAEGGKPYLSTPHDWGVDEYFFRSGELLAAYWDWEVLSFTEFEFDCSSGGVPHRHAINVMAARKRTP